MHLRSRVWSSGSSEKIAKDYHKAHVIHNPTIELV